MDGGIPEIVLEGFSVKIDGQPVPIPSRVYRDIGEPIKPPGGYVTLSEKSGNIIVSYSGSDGVGSFTCDFVFKGSRFERANVYPYGSILMNLEPLVRE